MPKIRFFFLSTSFALVLAAFLYLWRGALQIGWGQWLWDLRLPALICAAMCGMALSLAGLVLQSYFRNPLAGPYVMGSASGASLGVAFALFVLPLSWSGHFGVVPFALMGSLSTTLGIVLLARRANSVQVLVAGMLFAQVCSALVSVMVRFGEDTQLRQLATWNQASFQAPDLAQSLQLSMTILVVTLGLMWKSLSLDAMLLGEFGAHFSGHYRSRDRILLLGFSSILTALVVSWCGPIAFVGMVTPLLVQSWLRSSRHVILIPANALLGALIGVGVLHGQEWGDKPLLPLDAVASIFSVPFLLIYLARRGTRRA